MATKTFSEFKSGIKRVDVTAHDVRFGSKFQGVVTTHRFSDTSHTEYNTHKVRTICTKALFATPEEAITYVLMLWHNDNCSWNQYPKSMNDVTITIGG